MLTGLLPDIQASLPSFDFSVAVPGVIACIKMAVMALNFVAAAEGS